MSDGNWFWCVVFGGFVFDIRFRDSAYSLSLSLSITRWILSAAKRKNSSPLFFIPSMCQWDLFALLFTSICYTANAIPIMGKVSNRSHLKYPPKRSLSLSTAATAVTEATAEQQQQQQQQKMSIACWMWVGRAKSISSNNTMNIWTCCGFIELIQWI